MRKHRDSLRRRWDKVSNEDICNGIKWYPDARKLVRWMAKHHHTTEIKVAGIMAALSQRARWGPNVSRTAGILMHLDVYGLPAAAEKARLIRDGADPVDALGPSAYKVRAFYRALRGDNDAVVIDVWMLRAMNWEGGYTESQYNKLADIITAEAARVGLTPVAYQAIIWCYERGKAQ